MRLISNTDYEQTLRVLWWAAVQGDGSTRSREWRRKAVKLARKLERMKLKNKEHGIQNQDKGQPR